MNDDSAVGGRQRGETVVAPGLVSVVAPTIRRPQVVGRAIRSILRQTYPAIEVICVIDGPDAETEASLATIADNRLRVIALPAAVGAGGARNRGGSVARGAWIAFLDDDDEWLPTKLALQLAGRDPALNVVLSCRCRIETACAGTQVWPRRRPRPGETVDDYLYGRGSLLQGETYLATPTLVMPTRLFQLTRFGMTRQNEDTTLLLRATKLHGADLVMHPDTPVIVHRGEPADSSGQVFSWRKSLDWIESVRNIVSPLAYSGFCLVTLAAKAAQHRDWRAVLVLAPRARRGGAPTLLQYGLFAAYWLTTPRFRQRLTRLILRLRHRG